MLRFIAARWCYLPNSCVEVSKKRSFAPLAIGKSVWKTWLFQETIVMSLLPDPYSSVIDETQRTITIDRWIWQTLCLTLVQKFVELCLNTVYSSFEYVWDIIPACLEEHVSMDVFLPSHSLPLRGTVRLICDHFPPLPAVPKWRLAMKCCDTNLVELGEKNQFNNTTTPASGRFCLQQWDDQWIKIYFFKIDLPNIRRLEDWDISGHWSVDQKIAFKVY